MARLNKKTNKWEAPDNEDRELYVINVENWYLMHESSGLSMKKFLKEHKEELDKEILGVLNNGRD